MLKVRLALSLAFLREKVLIQPLHLTSGVSIHLNNCVKYFVKYDPFQFGCFFVGVQCFMNEQSFHTSVDFQAILMYLYTLIFFYKLGLFLAEPRKKIEITTSKLTMMCLKY